MIKKIIERVLQKHLMLEQNDRIAEIINSAEFKRWFGDSVMVDADDNPMIFYHGSPHEFDVFDKSKFASQNDAGWLGEGFYFYTDKDEARGYGKVGMYFLKIENPYHATYADNKRLSKLNDVEASREFSENLKMEGYDGVYFNENLRGEIVVFEPNQIWKIK